MAAGGEVTVLEWCLGSCSLWEAYVGSVGRDGIRVEQGRRVSMEERERQSSVGRSPCAESVFSSTAVGEKSPRAYLYA